MKIAVLSLSGTINGNENIAVMPAENPQTIEWNRKGNTTMGKPKIFGINKTFIPNSKADQRKNKPFLRKKGKSKK